MGKNSTYPWSKTKKEVYGYTAASQVGWYNKKIWKDIRNTVLNEEPLCRLCAEKGKVTPAVLVDHIVALKGVSQKDWDLFIDIDNVQPLCQSCHIRKTKQDNSKYSEDNKLRGAKLMNDLET